MPLSPPPGFVQRSRRTWPPSFNFDNYHTKFQDFSFVESAQRGASKVIGVAASQIFRPCFSHFIRISFRTLIPPSPGFFFLSRSTLLSHRYCARRFLGRMNDKIGHNCHTLSVSLFPINFQNARSLGQPLLVSKTTGLRESFRDNRERWEKTSYQSLRSGSERDRPCRRPINPFLFRSLSHHFSISVISLTTQMAHSQSCPTSGRIHRITAMGTSHPRVSCFPDSESLRLIIH